MSSSIQLANFASGELLSHGVEQAGDGTVETPIFRTFWGQDGSICIQVWDESTGVVLRADFNAYNFEINSGKTVKLATMKPGDVPHSELGPMHAYMLGILGINTEQVDDQI